MTIKRKACSHAVVVDRCDGDPTVEQLEAPLDIADYMNIPVELLKLPQLGIDVKRSSEVALPLFVSILRQVSKNAFILMPISRMSS